MNIESIDKWTYKCIKIQDVHSSEEEKDPVVASLNNGNFTCICIRSGSFIK